MTTIFVVKQKLKINVKIKINNYDVYDQSTYVDK